MLVRTDIRSRAVFSTAFFVAASVRNEAYTGETRAKDGIRAVFCPIFIPLGGNTNGEVYITHA